MPRLPSRMTEASVTFSSATLTSTICACFTPKVHYDHKFLDIRGAYCLMKKGDNKVAYRRNASKKVYIGGRTSEKKMCTWAIYILIIGSHKVMQYISIVMDNRGLSVRWLWRHFYSFYNKVIAVASIFLRNSQNNKTNIDLRKKGK